MSELKESAEAIGADTATALYGVTGSGVRIGIISDSYDALGGAAANVAAGDLPTSVTVISDSADGTDEAQAMMELAYQVAPGAAYDVATCGESLSGFAAAVTSLQDAGCTVIVDDVTFPSEESLYQTGTVLDQAIEAAIAAGVNYFTATGNSGDDYVQQGFAPITVTLPGISPFALTANDFGGDSPYQPIAVGQGASVTINLEWAQPFATIGSGGGGAQNSLAFYLLDSAGQIVAASTDMELGQNPVQTLVFTNDTGATQFNLVVVGNGGTTPTGQIFTISVLDSGLAVLEGAGVGIGTGDVMGHALVPGVNAVGAVTYSSTPAFGVSPAVPAYYTATGPGVTLYGPDGEPLAAPVSAAAPDFLAVAGSPTTVTGFAPFNGTSAAAPNAAAVAALMLSANETLTTGEVTALLKQSAIPVASTMDDTGAGLIQARAAVELSVAAAGTLWSAAGGGDWTMASGWSGGSLPTAAGAVMLGDDLGAISGSYGLVVNTPEAAAGAVTLSAPQGQSVTLTLGDGAALAVGGPPVGGATVGGLTPTAITAGEFLVGAGGTLSLAGGTLSVGGSLNSNDGTVAMTGGTMTAADFTQDAGVLTVDGGTVSLTGTLGLAQTGGALAIGADGVIDTTTASLSAAAVSVAGTLNDAGGLSLGSAGGAATLTIAATGSLSIGAGASGVAIAFAGGGGLLDFTSDSDAVLTGGLTALISGFEDGAAVIEFGALTYTALDSADDSGGLLTITDGGSDLARLTLSAPAADDAFALKAGPADQLEVVAVPCFAAGTRLLTARGAVAVEALVVGEHVVTADGASAPIVWTGQRRLNCRRHPDPGAILPVRIAAHAFGEGLPGRDLLLSPDHAIFAESVLVPIKHLVDGGAVRQVDVASVTYVHIEFARHEIVLAEGLPVESYLNAGDRAAFGGGSVIALHPDWEKPGCRQAGGDVALFGEALAYAPIRVTGEEVDRLRAGLAARRRNRRRADQPRGGASRTRLTA